MQWLIRWGVKKWLVGVVNTALRDYAAQVNKARVFLVAAVAKVETVAAFLRSLSAKLEDGTVTDAEADEAVEEAKTLAAKLMEKSNG